MRILQSWISRISAMLLLCFAGVVAAEEVCRSYSFEGMHQTTTEIKSLLGPNTTKFEDMKVYIGWSDGLPYIQSNFLSVHPEQPNQYADFPTKIRSEAVKDLSFALLNIIYWGDTLPAGARDNVAKALESVTVYVDESMIRANGEVAFDLGPVEKIKIVSGNRELPYGEVKLLKLKEPPPIATEVIDGCCLRGRPPGKKAIILQKLQQRKFDASNFMFLPLLGASGTHNAIRERMPTLKAAAGRTSIPNQEWNARLDQALNAARGQSLIVMSHMEGNKLSVRSPDGPAFEILLTTLRDRAREMNVDLILLGCDTAAYIKDASQDLGIHGTIDSITVAERLEKAVQSSTNVADLAQKMATDDIQIVVYDEKGGHGYAGASGFARVRNSNFFARVFRLLSLRKED